MFTLYMGTVYTLSSEAMLAVTTGKAPEHAPSALCMHCSVQPRGDAVKPKDAWLCYHFLNVRGIYTQMYVHTVSTHSQS